MPTLSASSSFLLLLAIVCPVGHASASELTVAVEDKKQLSTEGSIVELVGENLETAASGPVVINQIKREFDPLLSIIPKGSAVQLNNSDAYSHHVYSVSKGNKFDLPLYKGKPPKDVVFDAAGIVKLGCNIHDWMLAYVYISQSQTIATTDASGIVTFVGIPAGSYQLRVWNHRMRNTKRVVTRKIDLADGQALKTTVQVSLRKKIRKRKQTESSDSGYGGANY